MKKHTLSLAIKATGTVALLATSVHAVAAPEIYGQIRLSSTYQDIKETDKNGIKTETKRPDLDSGNSRLGFKGSEPLSENTNLEYRLEYRINVAESTDSNFSARYGYLALDNKQYGKLQVGRTISQDDFLDVSAAWWRNAGAGFDFGHGADWVNNSVTYYTPKFNNGKTDAFIQYGMDEGKEDAVDKSKKGSRSFSTFVNGVSTEVSRDFVMVGANHNTDKASMGFAYTRAGGDLSSLRASGTYKATDKVTLGAVGQYTDFNSNDNELGLFLSATYKVNEPTTVWLEGYRADNYKGYANGKSSGMNLGVQYDVSKNLLGFANIGYGKNSYGDVAKKDAKGVEIGAVYRF